MAKLSLPLVQLVHENLSIVMTFAFSREPLERLVDEKFEGEWRYLKKFVLDISEERATKACIELAIYLRALDDEVQISKWLRENTDHTFGTVITADGSTERLPFREVANKIIHATTFKWDFSAAGQPQLICLPRDNQRWHQACVDFVAVAVLCGQFLS